MPDSIQDNEYPKNNDPNEEEQYGYVDGEEFEFEDPDDVFDLDV